MSRPISWKDGSSLLGFAALPLTQRFWLDEIDRPTFHSFRAGPWDFVATHLRRHACWLSDYVERWENSRRFYGIGGQSRTVFVFCGRGVLRHLVRAVNFSGDVSRRSTVTVHCVTHGEHIRRPSSSTDFIQLLAVVGAPDRVVLLSPCKLIPPCINICCRLVTFSCKNTVQPTVGDGPHVTTPKGPRSELRQILPIHITS